MKEDLLQYMSHRSGKPDIKKKITGPVLTFSREKGCPANEIAEKLVQRLHEEKRLQEWKWVSTEIVKESAKRLHMSANSVNHVIYSENKGFVRDLILSFGQHYNESDEMVKKTLQDLIIKSAAKGKVIIVGLGGVGICHGIEKSLHIKFHAPLKHRIKEVMKRENMKEHEAQEYMDETDENRKMLIDYYHGLKVHGNELFDASFNTSTLSQDLIIDAIISLMKSRKLI